MTILGDFTVIRDDNSVEIGDGSNENGFTETFNTSGRRSSAKAFISFMVRGMTSTTDNADIFVNDIRVGVLNNNKGGETNQWQTQTVVFNGSVLVDGDNTLRMGAVPNTENQNDTFDNYHAKSIICHFHQESN